MKRNDKVAYHQKSSDELQKILSEKIKDLSEERVKYTSGTTKDSSVFKKIKYQIAFIKTLLYQK